MVGSVCGCLIRCAPESELLIKCSFDDFLVMRSPGASGSPDKKESPFWRLLLFPDSDRERSGAMDVKTHRSCRTGFYFRNESRISVSKSTSDGPASGSVIPIRFFALLTILAIMNITNASTRKLMNEAINAPYFSISG